MAGFYGHLCKNRAAVTDLGPNTFWKQPGQLSQYSDQATGSTTGVRFPTGGGTFFATASRPPPEPTQPRVQGVSGAVFQGVKRLGSKADH